MKENNDYDFVARHYRHGAFNTGKAWRRLGIGGHTWWTRTRIAACVAVFMAVSATATLLIRNSYYQDPAAVEAAGAMDASPEDVRVIDFDGATLTAVIQEVRKVYGVEVAGVPENADDMHLTLHYEGDAESLVETINEILGTELKIVKP